MLIFFINPLVFNFYKIFTLIFYFHLLSYLNIPFTNPSFRYHNLKIYINSIYIYDKEMYLYGKLTTSLFNRDVRVFTSTASCWLYCFAEVPSLVSKLSFSFHSTICLSVLYDSQKVIKCLLLESINLKITSISDVKQIS